MAMTMFSFSVVEEEVDADLPSLSFLSWLHLVPTMWAAPCVPLGSGSQLPPSAAAPVIPSPPPPIDDQKIDDVALTRRTGLV